MTKSNDNFGNENGGIAQLNYATCRRFNVTSGEVDLIGNGRDNESDGVNMTFGSLLKDFMAKAYNKPFKVVETITQMAPARFSISGPGLINSLHGTILFPVKIAPAN